MFISKSKTANIKKSSKLIVNETYKSVNIFGFASHVVSVITIVHLYKYSVKAAMGHKWMDGAVFHQNFKNRWTYFSDSRFICSNWKGIASVGGRVKREGRYVSLWLIHVDYMTEINTIL